MARPESWLESGIRALLELSRVSPERRDEVLSSIQDGSRPTSTYYVLLGISELIAGFALIIDSDATLIGANVVAPLMTPIFGVALGLARGDLRLLRIALIAEFGGAAVGVALCFGLGLLPFAVETTLSSRSYVTKVRAWKASGYRVVLHFIGVPSAEFAVQRVASRVAMGGHSIPEHDIRRRFERGRKLFDAVYRLEVPEWYQWFSDSNGLNLVATHGSAKP